MSQKHLDCQLTWCSARPFLSIECRQHKSRIRRQLRSEPARVATCVRGEVQIGQAFKDCIASKERSRLASATVLDPASCFASPPPRHCLPFPQVPGTYLTARNTAAGPGSIRSSRLAFFAESALPYINRAWQFSRAVGLPQLPRSSELAIEEPWYLCRTLIPTRRLTRIFSLSLPPQHHTPKSFCVVSLAVAHKKEKALFLGLISQGIALEAVSPVTIRVF